MQLLNHLLVSSSARSLVCDISSRDNPKSSAGAKISAFNATEETAPDITEADEAVRRAPEPATEPAGAGTADRTIRTGATLHGLVGELRTAS